jgi:hypothetical protein
MASASVWSTLVARGGTSIEALSRTSMIGAAGSSAVRAAGVAAMAVKPASSDRAGPMRLGGTPTTPPWPRT